MNPELQQRIAAIKAACEEILRLSEKATMERWESDGDVVDTCMGVIHCDTQSDSETNASFIAHSRNVSPAMARVVLMWLNRWLEIAAESPECAQSALLEIADQWEGKL